MTSATACAIASADAGSGRCCWPPPCAGSACSKKAESKAEPKGGTASAAAVPVAVATVEQKAMPVQIQAIGSVEANSVVSVKAQVGGELVRVHFKEGQDVKKGDLLFTIDRRPFQAALGQAEATLAQHQAQVRQARRIWRATRRSSRTPASRRSATGGWSPAASSRASSTTSS